MPFDNALASLVASPVASPLAWLGVTLAAVILDALIGDPPSRPHPVRYIGALLGFLERRARKAFADPLYAGCAAALAALAVTGVAVQGLLLLPGALAKFAALYLVFSGLALGQLIREGKTALALLEADDIPGARAAVGGLVSRDVSTADRAELSRVLAESLAENVNDAFVAPFFWYVIGGPLGLWLYKTASTMDSMWGYRHEPWTRFGAFAARLDDALAFIPARVTAAAMLALAKISGKTKELHPTEYATVRNDARKMQSPNAGWPMSAAAWVCGGTMGGRAVYAGEVMEKPLLGPENEPWTAPKLRVLLRLLTYTGMGAAGVLTFFGLLWRV